MGGVPDIFLLVAVVEDYSVEMVGIGSDFGGADLLGEHLSVGLKKSMRFTFMPDLSRHIIKLKLLVGSIDVNLHC